MLMLLAILALAVSCADSATKSNSFAARQKVMHKTAKAHQKCPSAQKGLNTWPTVFKKK